MKKIINKVTRYLAKPPSQKEGLSGGPNFRKEKLGRLDPRIEKLKSKPKLERLKKKKDKETEKDKLLKKGEKKMNIKLLIKKVENKEMIKIIKNKILKNLKLPRINFIFRPLKTVSVFLLVLITIFGQLISPQVASAATYDFVQSGWAGGATANVANHENNQTEWNQFVSKNGVDTSSTVSLTPSSPLSSTKTSWTDFNTGVNSQTEVLGAGDSASIKIDEVNFTTPMVVQGKYSNGTAYSLKSDGTVWAWGDNGYGQIGNNSTVKSLFPVQVLNSSGTGPLTNIISVAAGDAYALALKSDGTVWSWGYNGEGELGDGTIVSESTPIQVHGVGGVGFLTDIVSIQAGYYSSYALKSDGTVWAWGNNHNGQLGDNTTTQSTTPVQVLDSTGFEFLTEITKIAVGVDVLDSSVYALKSDGTVWAWGFNGNGELGDNTVIEKHLPVQVLDSSGVGYLTDVVDIAAGEAYVLALKSDGTVFGFGWNDNGRIGDGTRIERHLPTKVVGVGGSGYLADIISISSGFNSSYALKSDGTVWSWGVNSSGCLGDGSGAAKITPVQVHGVNNLGYLTNVISVSGGNNAVSVLKSDGTVWSWGKNNVGQLGNNTTTSSNVPVQVLWLELADFNIGATTNVGVSGCVSDSYLLKSDGTVYAWGYGGRLGDSTTVQRNVPTQVHGVNNSGYLTDMTFVSGGNIAGYTIKSDGTVWSWGENGSGQLGDNTTTQRNTPVQVVGPGGVGYLTDVVFVEGGAGDDFAVALKSDGTVWSWGGNGSGQLGNNTIVNALTPVQVVGPGGVGYLTNVVTISAGFYVVLALKADGTVWAWGRNNSGQLGDNTTTARSVPVQVVGVGGSGYLTDIIDVEVGLWSGDTTSSYALKSDGTVYSWGSYFNGRLGHPSSGAQLTPGKVLGPGGVGFLAGVEKIEGGGGDVLVLKSDGTLWGWGRNDNGQLGDGTYQDKSYPIQIPGLGGIGTLTGVVDVHASREHSVAIKSDGSVLSWGSNYYGQLGDNTSIRRNTPTSVKTLLAPINFNIGTTNYYSSGNYISPVVNLDKKSELSTASYSATLNGQTITVDMRAGNTSVPDITWTNWQTNIASGGSIASLSNNQYIQYRVNLATSNTALSPSFDSITINYNQYSLTGDLTSSVYDTADSTNLLGKISWVATNTSSEELVKFQVRSSADGNTWSEWCGYADCTGTTYFNLADNGISIPTNHPLKNGANDRYLQYKVFLMSAGGKTPILSSVSLQYVVNAAPVFNTNYPTEGAGGVVAVQNADSQSSDFSKINISYSARDIDTNTGTTNPNKILASFEYSIDGGSNWESIPPEDLGVSDLTPKTILGNEDTIYSAVWSAKTTAPNVSVANAKIRVTINDNEAANNTTTASTADFSLDTKAPEVITPVTFDAGVAGVSNGATITIPLPSDTSSVYYKIIGSEYSLTDPVDVWTLMTEATTIPWTFDADVEIKTLSYQFKDAFGNESVLQTTSSQTPVPSSSFIVQDTSNISANPAYYDMYIGWQTATGEGFGSYKLEYATSLNNSTYSEYTPVPNVGLSEVNTNYYIFRNLDSSLFYRFRLGVVGLNGNTSVRSNAFTTAKPDGVQNYGEGGGGSVATASKVENVIVTQDNNDKKVTVSYKLTDTSFIKKVNPTYESYLFYNIGITLPSNALSGNTIKISDTSKLNSSGYVLINNEVVSYSGKSDETDTLTGVVRGTWPTLASTGRATRTNPTLLAGTPVWVMANGTSPIEITNNTISTGQYNTIAWDTYQETILAGATYSNVDIKALVHDKQDVLSGPLSNQNDFSENGILNTFDLTAPAISFTESSSTGLENVPLVTLNLNLARSYPKTVSVKYTMTGTATNIEDYTLANGTVIITAGDTSATIEIPIINDTLKEEDETIIITLSDPSFAILGTNSIYTYTIIDDDTSSGIEFGKTSGEGLESITAVDIPVILAEISGADVTVDYTISGTAISGEDYTLVNGTVTIGAGQDTANISLAVINDILKEESKTVIITLSNAVGATLGLNNIYTYTIIDDDIYPTLGFDAVTSQGAEDVNTADIPVSISAPYAEDVTFSYTVTGGTAEGNEVDYLLPNGVGTILAGETSTNISLIIFDDEISEETETIIITISNPTNAILGTNTIHAYSILDNEIIVSDVSGSNIKSTSARIAWTTADYTDSLIEYDIVNPGAEGLYSYAKSSLEKVLIHNVYLGNLIPSTKYYFKTTSINLAGETTVSNGEFTTTPGPIISNVGSSDVTDTGVTIKWNTDIPATSYVSYSTDGELATPLIAGSAVLTIEHSVVLAGLNSGSIYYYLVDGADESGNVGEDANGGSYYNFSTGEDETAPTLSVPTVPIITASQVAIVWTTNELADGMVRYGTSTGDYQDESELLLTPVINHLVALSELEESTQYYYVVESSDENGNTAVSDEYIFETTAIEKVIVSSGGGGMIGVAQELYDILLAENQSYKARLSGLDSNIPVVSNIEVSEITAFGATVSFQTSEDTVAFIEYGKDEVYNLMAADKSWSMNHVIRLYGLNLGTEYNFKINAMDKSNDVGYSENEIFTTKFLSEDVAELQKIDNVEQFQAEIEATIESILPSLVPPFIDKPVVSEITENSAVITFRTNIKSYPIVSYTTDEKYSATKENPYDGEMSDTSQKRVSHTLSLIGLRSNTKYHVMVKAFSLPQVVGKSEDFTFTTAASKIQASVIDIKKDSFVVVWSTDEPTSSIVEYKNITTGRVSKIVDDIKNSSHSIMIENLTHGTPYEINVSGINGKGNLVESGSPINIRTSTDNIAPVITNLKVDSALVVGRTDKVQTIISWQTDEPSTSVVYYQEGSGSIKEELSNKQEDLQLTKSHVVILTAFKPGTVYRFTVSSTDDASNTIKPPIRTIITPKKTESIVDIIFKNFDETFNFINNVR